jgi:hypothetical protein
VGLEWARRELEEIREHVRSAPASKELEERLQEQMHEVWDRLADIAEKTMDPFDEELEAASAHMGTVHRAALDAGVDFGAPADMCADPRRANAARLLRRRRLFEGRRVVENGVRRVVRP